MEETPGRKREMYSMWERGFVPVMLFVCFTQFVLYGCS